MTGWQPISVHPDRPMPVLLFFANAHFRGRDDIWRPAQELMEDFRDERVLVGFWDGTTWCENGSGHDVFEDWRAPHWQPTHWMPLPEPPK